MSSDGRQYRPFTPRRFTDAQVRASIRRAAQQGRQAKPWPPPHVSTPPSIHVITNTSGAPAARQEPT